jgi:hypothetical protein
VSTGALRADGGTETSIPGAFNVGARAAAESRSQQSLARTRTAQLESSSLFESVSQQHAATTRFIMWQKNCVRAKALPGRSSVNAVKAAISWARRGRMPTLDHTMEAFERPETAPGGGAFSV